MATKSEIVFEEETYLVEKRVIPKQPKKESVPQKSEVLDLFNSLQQKETTSLYGISEDDKAFCETEERKLQDALAFYQKAKAWIEANCPQNEYTASLLSVSRHSSIQIKPDHYVKAYNKTTAEFIHNIYQYFREKYHTDGLDSGISIQRIFPKGEDKYYGKYASCGFCEAVSYKSLLQDIFNKIGGKTFQDYAIFGLKRSFRKELRGRKGASEAKVKGKEVTLSHFVQIEESSFGGYRFTYGSEETYFKVLQILNLFSEGFIGIQWKPLGNELRPEPGRFYESHLDKIEGITFYKNNNVKIKFSTSVLAKEFYQSYCTIPLD